MIPASVLVLAASVFALPPPLPPPPVGPPPPRTPTLTETVNLAPGETRSIPLVRGDATSTRLLVFSDASVAAAVIPAEDVASFRSGGPARLIAQAQGPAGDVGDISLPAGPLALVCRNPTTRPATAALALFRSADLEGRSAIWSGVLEPGERAFTPCNPVAADALRFFLLSAGLRASIVTPAEAERARTGGPFVPVLASRFGTDIAILSGLRAFQVIDELFDVSVNGPRVLLVENPGQQAVGGLAFVQLNASSNSDLGAITLPPYNSCRPILSKSRGVRGTFDGHVLRTGLSDLDPDAELRVECVEIPTGTTPEILAPFALVELVQREGDRAEFRLRSIVPTFDGQFPVRVRLTSADSDGTRFSPTREAFYVTLDQVADPPSEPRLEPSTDRGSSNSDGITSTGPVLLTGTGEAYARVMLQRGRRPLGAASAVVAPNGTWSISFTPPTPGVYTLTAVQLDEAGNLSERSEPTTIRVVRPPAPPGAVSVPRRDRVALRDGVLVVTPRARIEGRDTPGTLIVVRVNCQEVGTARTGPMGRWSLVLPAPLSNERVSEIVAARRAAGGVDSLPGPVLRVRARP